ncbi:MAG: exodeoxyribonuclease V subunit gamma, partial [Actinomycetia bacterium]|nr:exodeoxyribonuclease V subunit gamma [Actinomycetes bacterium]
MLRLYRAERADALVRGLADVLEAPPDDPFTPDVVAVPSQGVERWIAQQLSMVLGTNAGRHDGVCTNVEFPSPSRLIAAVLAAVASIEPDDDPWRTRRLVWPLLDVIDASATEPWAATLGRHLGLIDAPGRERRANGRR